MKAYPTPMAREDYPTLAALAVGFQELKDALDEIDYLRYEFDRTGRVPLPLRVDRLAFTASEVAKFVGVTASTVVAEVKRGHLRAVKIGSRSRFTQQAIDEWLAHTPNRHVRDAS